MFAENVLSQTENFLLLYVLGLLLHSDASMRQLDIPVIVICNFFTKEYLSKISGVCHFSPFCVLYVVRYNKTNMTSLCSVLYKYDIPVWCTTGITPPREECRPRATLLSRGSYSCCTPHRDVIFVLLYRTTYKTQKGENLQTPEILDKYSFVKNLQISITGIVALTHQSEREAPKRTTGENFQFDSEKFLKTWTNESTRCFASFFKYNLYQKTFKLHLLIPPLNQSMCLCISKTLNLICLFVLLLSLLVRVTLTVVPAVV